MSEETFDVIVVGMGPVGLTMAATLAHRGRRVAVVEKHAGLYGLPRAGHIDHEIVRILQSIGAADPVLKDAYPAVEYVWKNRAGETLLEFDWGARSVSGYNSDYMQYQPILEDALFSKINGHPMVKLYRGWEAADFDQLENSVEAVLYKTEVQEGSPAPVRTNITETIRGAWLVGADGANSAVRRWLGVDRDDLGFNERWLDVDARKKRDFSLDFDCGQICDPARPITVLPLGKRHRRWEWSLLAGETREELERPETAWKLLAEQGITSDDVEIVRQLVYTFEARIAKSWRVGRVFLIGDAAHTMPPFQGQGMCSGMRDALNLAWKFDHVMRGHSSAELLETYQQERYPHVRDWTLISIESGKIPCTLDPREAEERDARFRAGWRPPMPDFPKLNEGVLGRDTAGALMPLAGELGFQARVGKSCEVGLFDDLCPGFGYSIVSPCEDPREYLTGEQLVWLDSVDTRIIHVGAADRSDVEVVDTDGDYARYFADNAIEVMVVRPDFYVFGAGRMDELSYIAEELKQQIFAAPRAESGFSSRASDRTSNGARATEGTL